MIRGIWVEFDNAVKKLHVHLLNKYFECDLKYVIEDNLEDASNSIKIIPEKKMERIFDELSLELNLWKNMSQECNLLVPRCRNLNPHIISKWILMKPPSDTMTKIIYSICTALPVNVSAPEISRLLKHCTCDSMKTHQACASKSMHSICLQSRLCEIQLLIG